MPSDMPSRWPLWVSRSAEKEATRDHAESLAIPSSSAILSSAKGKKPPVQAAPRGSTATEAAKKRRCTKGAEGEPSGFFTLQRTKVFLEHSLLSVHERDLALANVEGSLNEIRLLKGERAPTLDSEETRLLSRKEELKISEEGFDSIISQLQSECTLTPCLGEPKGRDPVIGEGEDDGT
ncbi:hypothetical protein Bca4012_037782 [Brassica carinata]